MTQVAYNTLEVTTEDVIVSMNKAEIVSVLMVRLKVKDVRGVDRYVRKNTGKTLADISKEELASFVAKWTTPESSRVSSDFSNMATPLPMVRHDNADTSHEAAKRVEMRMSSTRAATLMVLNEKGPLTDEQLEKLPVFSHFGPKTIGKRRTDLVQLGLARMAGVVLNSRGISMQQWVVTLKGKAEAESMQDKGWSPEKLVIDRPSFV